MVISPKDIQHRLNEIGFGPLEEDNRYGPRTIAAIKKFQKASSLVADGKVGPKTLNALFPITPPVIEIPKIKIPSGKPLLTTKQIIAKYGQPGNPANMQIMTLPYPMIIEWAPDTICRKIQFHKLGVERLQGALEDILSFYGLEEIKRLKIDVYSGAYSFRQQRGGTDWSRHSWPIAIDLFSQGNQLRWGRDRAVFAKPEYRKMAEAFYKNGFIGLGPEKNYDWMHWELAS